MSKMDPILEPSKHLIPDWIDRIIEECKDEAIDNESLWPLKLLGMTTRRMVWNLCDMLRVRSKGVPGQVCRLVEKYLAARFCSMSNLNSTLEEWEEFKQSLIAHIPLLIASAIQLSAKMSSMSEQVRASTVQKVLAMKGMDYSITEINVSEFDMLKNLDFRIPLWTSVDVAELFTTDVGMPPQMLRGVVAIVDLAEFNRFKIEADLVLTATTYAETIARSKLRTLHLCAGAVLASARHLNFKGPDPVARLATLSRVPCAFLSCISDIVLQYIKKDERRPHILRKRKISLD